MAFDDLRFLGLLLEASFPVHAESHSLFVISAPRLAPATGTEVELRVGHHRDNVTRLGEAQWCCIIPRGTILTSDALVSYVQGWSSSVRRLFQAYEGDLGAMLQPQSLVAANVWLERLSLDAANVDDRIWQRLSSRLL